MGKKEVADGLPVDLHFAVVHVSFGHGSFVDQLDFVGHIGFFSL